MKKFAPMLLIGGVVAEDSSDANHLLTNLLFQNRNKYLNLLGLDDEYEQHSNAAFKEMQNAFREPKKRESEHEVPVYHVNHDSPYAPRVPKPRKELYDELRKNQGEPVEDEVPIPIADMKYDVPIY